MGVLIKDKVQLEQIIDNYLVNDIPLSLLTETYNLTYPQLQLLINRTIGFSRQKDKMMDINPEFMYDELSENVLNIPHIMPEEYPMRHDDVMDLFKRLAEIKEELAFDEQDKLKSVAQQYQELKDKIDKYDKDVIKRIENVLVNMRDDMDSDDLAELLYRNGIGIRNLQELNKMYAEYIEDNKKLAETEKEYALLDKTLREKKERKYSLELEYEKIRETLTVCNVKLVNWCIRKFFNNIPLDKEEAQAFGLEGLALAINGFDYTLGFHFSSYAVSTIVHHIERHFNELYGMSWDNFTKKESIRYYRKLMREEDPEATRDASPQELADLGLINLSARQIANFDDTLDAIVPMSSVYPDLEAEWPDRKMFQMPLTFEDYNAIDNYQDNYEVRDENVLEEEIFRRAAKEGIMEVIATLPAREGQVLIERFGLNGGSSKSLEEVGRLFNVTRERIRQIEAKAIRHLRHPSRSKVIRDYYDDVYRGYSKSRINMQISNYNNLIYLLLAGKSRDEILFFMNNKECFWSSNDIDNIVLILKTICEMVKYSFNNSTESLDKIFFAVKTNISNCDIPYDSFKKLVHNLEALLNSTEKYLEMVPNKGEEPSVGTK